MGCGSSSCIAYQSAKITPHSQLKKQQLQCPEIFRLRRILKEQSSFPLIDKMIFVIYCPPHFPLTSISEYLSERVNLPIVPNEDPEDLLHEIKTNERFNNGFILTNFSTVSQEVEAFKSQMRKLGMKVYLLFFEVEGMVSQSHLSPRP